MTDDQKYENINNPEEHRSTLLTQEFKDTRSFVQRTFGPLTPGCERSTIIAMTISAMGSGLLALPSNASQSGILLSVIILFMGGFISYYNVHILMKNAFQHDIDTYSGMVEFALGTKMKIISEVLTVIYCFGVLVAFQIAFASFVWEACEYWNVSPSLQDDVLLYIKLGFIATNIWLSLLKDLYSLRYFTMIGLGAIVLTIFGIMINFMIYNSDIQFSGNVVYFTFDKYFFNTFASTFYCFICHQFVFPLKKELKRGSLRRMDKVAFRSIIIQLTLYSIILLFGYFTCLKDCPGLVIDYYHSLPFTIAKMAIALNLFFGVPLNLQPARSTVLSLIKKDSNTWIIITTVVFQGLSGLLAIVYPDIKSAFGLLGGLFGTIIVVVFPALIYVKLSDEKWTLKNIILLIAMAIIFTLGATGAVTSQIYH